jgi:hypothetical protein
MIVPGANDKVVRGQRLEQLIHTLLHVATHFTTHMIVPGANDKVVRGQRLEQLRNLLLEDIHSESQCLWYIYCIKVTLYGTFQNVFRRMLQVPIHAH